MGKNCLKIISETSLGAAYVVEVDDAKEIDTVADQISGLEHVNQATSGGDSTNSLVNSLETVRKVGAIFVVGLTIIALFMIANTIKITITSRQTEISIMRMVGASNWYIRIPFMLEGMLIGLIGSIIPIIVLVYGYGMVYDYANGALMSAMLASKTTKCHLSAISH